MNTTATKSRSTAWIIAVVALAVLGIAAIAFATTRKGSTTKVDTGSSSNAAGVTTTGAAAVSVATTPGQSVFPVTVQGAALEALPLKGSDPAVGKAFPELSGTSLLTGQPLAISRDGRAKLILFVAHWCPHCQREVPVVQSWLTANPPKGFDVYGISTGVDEAKGNYPPLAWLAKEKWSAPTLADSSQVGAAKAAGLSGYPFFVAVDKKGNVLARASGELTVDKLNDLAAKLAV